MVDVGTGILTILPKTDKLVTALTSSVNSAMSKVTSNTTTTMQKVTQGASVAFVALGAVAAGVIGKSISATVEWASEVRSLQRVTGQSAESASALVAVGTRLGLTVQALTTGFGIFEKNIINGATGFVKYGISVRDARGNLLPFDDILGVVADKFVSLKAGPEQAAFAMNIFGRSGKALIPILSKGSEGIAELKAEAEDMGLVMSQEDLDAAKNLSIAQRELGESFKGVAVTIGTEFLPIATKLLDSLSSMVQVAAQIPGPVYAITLGFLALTGVAALLIKLGQGIISTWSTVFGAFGVGATEVVAADAEIVAASTAATAAIEGEQLALEGLAVAETGAAVAGGAAAAGGIAALASGIISLGAVAAAGGTALAAYFTIGGPTAGQAFAGSAEALNQINGFVKEQSVLFDTLRGKVTAFSGDSSHSIRDLMDITREQALALGADANAFDYAARHGLTYDAAIKKIGDTTTAAIESITGAAGALTDPIIESTSAFVRLGTVVGGLSNPLDRFAKFSGADVNQVKGALATLLSDTKATGNDIVAVIQQMKGEWRAWHDSLVESFGGAGGALDQFSDQTHVDLGKAVGALHKYTGDIKAFGANIDTIEKRFGNQASAFISFASSQGLAQQGLVAAVANSNGKMAKSFVDSFNTADKATGDLATSIQKALDPTFSRIIVQLKNVVRAIQGIPTIKLNADASQAEAVMRSFFLRWDNQTLNAHVDVSGGGSVHGGRGAGHAAGGIITRQIATSAGPIGEAGPEAIIPLSRLNSVAPHSSHPSPVRVSGSLRMTDWKQGLVDLDGELDWERLARTS